MTEPAKYQFIMPGGKKVTSIVMEQADFDVLCDELERIDVAMRNVTHGGSQDIVRAKKEHIDTIRDAKMLPMMARGTKTEHIFDTFGVETDYITAIVRGQGRFLAKQFGMTEVVEDHLRKQQEKTDDKTTGAP
jgi:hypothetical protein